MKNYLQVNVNEMRIRPSAVSGHYECAFKWAKQFLEGVDGPTNIRAAIGTGVHASAEQFWEDVKPREDVETYSLSAMVDRGVAALDEEIKKGVDFGSDGENRDSAIKLISKGALAFAEDIAPFTPMPEFVEEYFEVPLDHWFVTAVGGTVDYYGAKTVSDIKTSSRKPTASSHVVQQSIYRYLVEANNHEVAANTIQGITLGKSKVEGNTLPLQTNVEQAKFMINGILDKLDIMQQDMVPRHVLFQGNPKSYLCSEKWCPNFKTCPFAQGKL